MAAQRRSPFCSDRESGSFAPNLDGFGEACEAYGFGGIWKSSRNTDAALSASTSPDMRITLDGGQSSWNCCATSEPSISPGHLEVRDKKIERIQLCFHYFDCIRTDPRAVRSADGRDTAAHPVPALDRSRDHA